MKRALLATLAVTITVAMAQPAHGQDAAALLLKHREFVGWQFGDGAFQSLSYDGVITKTVSGRSVVYADVRGLRAAVASRFTSTEREAATSTSTGFTGRIFWNSNRNGFTYPSLGDPQAFAVSQDVLFHEGTTELKGALGRTATIDGKAYDVVRVKPDQGDAIDLYIDPNTGAYRRAVIDPGGQREDYVDILGYLDFSPGKRVISKWKWSQSGYIHEWTKVTPNVPVSADALHPPPQIAHWTFTSGAAIPIEVHDTDVDRAIYVKASVNGIPGRFVVDTGAAGIFLNSGFAARTHVKRIDNGSAEGIGGEVATEIDRAQSIQIGQNTLSNVVVSSQNVNFGKDIDGVMGFDLLGGAIVDLDLDAQKMTIFDPAANQINASSGFSVIADLSDEVPVIPMLVNGKIPINATLDSGDEDAVTISPDLAAKYGLRMLVDKSVQGITSGIRFVRGVGGVERQECGLLDSVSSGQIVSQNMMACQSSSFSGNDALVGFDFIRHFNLLFDYPQAQIVLRPRKQ